MSRSFLREQGDLDEEVGFVAEIAIPLDAHLKSLTLSSVTIKFSADLAQRTIRHDPDARWQDVLRVEGTEITEANLDFTPGRPLRLAGKVTSSLACAIQVSAGK